MSTVQTAIEQLEHELGEAREQVRVLRGALEPVASFRIPGKRDLDSGGVQDEMRLMVRKARLALADTEEPKP